MRRHERTWLGKLIAGSIGIVMLVIGCEIFLRSYTPHWQEFSSARFILPAQDALGRAFFLGKPGFDGFFAQNNGDFRIRIAINEFGLRNPESASQADNQIWVVGDSMTFGWGVERMEMYSEIVERELGKQVYNISSPSTDVCGYQALVARMPAEAHPRAVVIGLILENDLRVYDCAGEAAAVRALAAAPVSSSSAPATELAWGIPGSLFGWKVYLTDRSALYNFFAISVKRVDVFNELLIKLGLLARPHIFQTNTTPEMLARQVETTGFELAKLKADLPAGTPFAVVVIPARFEIRNGDALYRDLRLSILADLTRRGIAAVDAFEVLGSRPLSETHFEHDGHWSAFGHELVGRLLATRLSSMLAD